MSYLWASATDDINLGNVAALQITGDISVFCWIKSTSTNTSQHLFGAYQTGSPFAGYALGFPANGSAPDAGKLGYWSNGVGSWQTSTGTYNDGAWHSVGFTVAGTGAGAGTFYGDGTADGTWTHTAPGAHNANKIIGARSDQTQGLTTGNIAEFAIWNGSIGADGAAMLGAGLSPLRVRPDLLVVYLPLRASTVELIGGNTGTATTPTVAQDHPRIFDSSKRRVLWFPGTADVTVTPVATAASSAVLLSAQTILNPIATETSGVVTVFDLTTTPVISAASSGVNPTVSTGNDVTVDNPIATAASSGTADIGLAAVPIASAASSGSTPEKIDLGATPDPAVPASSAAISFTLTIIPPAASSASSAVKGEVIVSGVLVSGATAQAVASAVMRFGLTYTGSLSAAATALTEELLATIPAVSSAAATAVNPTVLVGGAAITPAVASSASSAVMGQGDLTLVLVAAAPSAAVGKFLFNVLNPAASAVSSVNTPGGVAAPTPLPQQAPTYLEDWRGEAAIEHENTVEFEL